MHQPQKQFQRFAMNQSLFAVHCRFCNHCVPICSNAALSSLTTCQKSAQNTIKLQFLCVPTAINHCLWHDGRVGELPNVFFSPNDQQVAKLSHFCRFLMPHVSSFITLFTHQSHPQNPHDQQFRSCPSCLHTNSNFQRQRATFQPSWGPSLLSWQR